MELQAKPIVIQASRRQRRFLHSQAATVVYQGGARAGKTWAGSLKALLLALQYPNCRGMIVAPSYPMLKQAVVVELTMLADSLGLLQRWAWNKSDNEIVLHTGGRILLRTASNPSSLLGATLGWAVGDEVALWPKQAYDYLQGRLSDPHGSRQCVFTFTPKGTSHWTYGLLSESRAGLDVIRATSHDNPTLPQDYFERVDREYGRGSLIWRQEVLGEYVAFEGLVYPQFDVETHVVQVPEDISFVSVVGGVDWGWTNPGVLLVGGLDAEGVLWIVEEVYASEQTIEWWVDRAKELTEKWGVLTWYCDPSEPHNIHVFQREGLPATKAVNEIVPGLAAVGGRLYANTLRISLECTHLRSETLTYCFKQSRDGVIRPDQPATVNDHAMDAERYLVMGVTRASKPKIFF